MDGFPLPGMAHAELPSLTNGACVLILCVPWVLSHNLVLLCWENASSSHFEEMPLESWPRIF